MRQMERLLAKALRKAATRLATGAALVDGRVDVDVAELKELVGRPRFTPETAERTSVPGVATGLAVTGLAVTGLGGDVVASALEPVAASVSGSTTGVVTTAA